LTAAKPADTNLLAFRSIDNFEDTTAIRHVAIQHSHVGLTVTATQGSLVGAAVVEADRKRLIAVGDVCGRQNRGRLASVDDAPSAGAAVGITADNDQCRHQLRLTVNELPKTRILSDLASSVLDQQERYNQN
jgi:hypothetical protein